MHYSSDPSTHAIETQFFYGPSLLVSPVTEKDATSVSFYLPKDLFYDLFTLRPIRGTGATITYDDVPFDAIPVHIRGGSIIPARVSSGMTTTEVRTQDFELLIALDEEGKAKGSLYLDDGESIEQEGTSEIEFEYDGSTLWVGGSFGSRTEVGMRSVTVMSPEGALRYAVDYGLDRAWEVDLSTLQADPR